MAVEEKYPRNPTPEQIAEWKNLYGSVHLLSFEPEMQTVLDVNGDELEQEIYPEALCYLRAPSRKDIAYAQRSAESGGQLAFNQAILNNCFLGGDPIVKKNDAYFLGAGPHLAEIIEVKEGKLKKL